jgi:hypothetical protein
MKAILRRMRLKPLYNSALTIRARGPYSAQQPGDDVSSGSYYAMQIHGPEYYNDKKGYEAESEITSICWTARDE